MNRVSRRGALLGLGVTTSVRLAHAQDESTEILRARFSETTGHVWLTVDLEGLGDAQDRDLCDALDSGFATRIVVFWRLWQRIGGEKRLVAASAQRFDLYFDPWAHRYILADRTSSVPRTESFSDRAKLITALRSLRFSLVPASSLSRGPARYFVRMVAMRNPNPEAELSMDEATQARATRDGSFVRWLRLFMRQRPLAEAVVDGQTGEFYLP